MPTYEYRCDSCANNFDVVQSFQDDPLTECPTCGSPVRKVFGNVGIVFKGSGFYKTDSRGSSTAKAGGGEAAGATSEGSDSSSGSEGSSSCSGEGSSSSDSSTKEAKPAASTTAPSSEKSSSPKAATTPS